VYPRIEAGQPAWTMPQGVLQQCSSAAMSAAAAADCCWFAAAVVASMVVVFSALLGIGILFSLRLELEALPYTLTCKARAALASRQIRRLLCGNSGTQASSCVRRCLRALSVACSVVWNRGAGLLYCMSKQ
jgi:hypothetical protein